MAGGWGDTGAPDYNDVGRNEPYEWGYGFGQGDRGAPPGTRGRGSARGGSASEPPSHGFSRGRGRGGAGDSSSSRGRGRGGPSRGAGFHGMAHSYNQVSELQVR